MDGDGEGGRGSQRRGGRVRSWGQGHHGWKRCEGRQGGQNINGGGGAGAVHGTFVPSQRGGDAGTLCRRIVGPFDEGEASVESHGAKRFDFEIANCRNAGVEKPQDDMDPRGLGMGGAKLVRRGVDEVVEEAASGLDLNARGRSVIVANTVDGLSNEGVEGLVVGHELTGLPFARFDGRVNNRGGVHHGASLEGGDGRHEFRDGEGLAR